MWTEGPAISSNRDPRRTPAPLHPLVVVSPLFFSLVSSSFLIAANRDVKTIRALLADSDPMLSSFFAYSHSFSLSLSFHPSCIVTSTCVCLLKLPPSIIVYCLLLNSVRSKTAGFSFIHTGKETKGRLDTCFDLFDLDVGMELFEERGRTG